MQGKWINEFLLSKKIGTGAFAKVIQATRFFEDEDGKEAKDEYALKKMHKPTLQKHRCARYDENGKMQNVNNLEKVYNEIEVWTKCLYPSIVRIYEMIDSEDHDYIYIIMELAELGQLAHWEMSLKKYVRQQTIVDYVLDIIEMPEEFLPEPGSKQEEESVNRLRIK